MGWCGVLLTIGADAHSSSRRMLRILRLSLLIAFRFFCCPVDNRYMGRISCFSIGNLKCFCESLPEGVFALSLLTSASIIDAISRAIFATFASFPFLMMQFSTVSSVIAASLSASRSPRYGPYCWDGWIQSRTVVVGRKVTARCSSIQS